MILSFDYPAPTLEQKNRGWFIRFEYLHKIKQAIRSTRQIELSLEDIEGVLLTMKDMYDKG